ncbi:MAG: hypothetical protein Q4G22_14530 [Paracoccus sp. (in: a-proteobacteria)]|uniref:hypothetical protein n=1 Tax=Paracoccus sp. TaxID=267 RepID=UPI0026DFAFE7|nr:hypothetical protein [Paracoccus sp. (in: a-proteobacteria)]MDO5633030.1 hypothetical protein [Paracoccus sp. (in: a-proteobacteria)]
MTDRSPAYRDRLPPPVLPEGEREIARFTPDRTRYFRDHVALAAGGAVVVVLILWAIGRGHLLWTGVFGTFAAIAFRGMWFFPDAMRATWLLTNRALIGPGQDRVERGDIATVRRLMGDVQVVTRGGRKILIRHLEDSAAAVALIEGKR